MTYRLKLRVYYEDTDAGGIVYHARYLAFAERARTEALRQAGVPHDELVTDYGLIFVVRRIKMDYLRPVRLDAEMVVETGPWALGGATVDVQQRFVVAEQETGRLSAGLACIRAADGRPARIPHRWRDALGGAGH
ncbi:MAG: YbgC/FadM family acyl-CoA thioesterase [Acetobacteraceae bacterium]|nr:YbgC/FadM family acyl-CoA thioesterase [Acetobacteraceae bacterium]